MQIVLLQPPVIEDRRCIVFPGIGANTSYIDNFCVRLQVPRACREHGPARSAYLNACSGEQGAAECKRLFISDEHVCIVETVGDEARAPGRPDAGQLPWSGGCAENDRSASIDTNHKRLWTGLAEEAPDTGQSATGRYRNEYGIHFAVHLMIDFRPRAGVVGAWIGRVRRSEEHTSELQSRGHIVCRLL